MIIETSPKLEEFSLKSAPAQQRLYNYLVKNSSACTVTLRNTLSLGNVANTVAIVNKKLAASNEPKTIICLINPNVNKFGEICTLGTYHLVDSAAANDGTI